MTILAIDAGTTGVTALLVSPAGEVLSTGYSEFPQYFPADGCVEHELGEIWAATLTATRHALTWGDVTITAIGITNQRETICFWDRETLGGARRAIVWQDRRSAALCLRLREAGHEPFVTEATGLRLDPYFSATKLAWVREHEPAIWQRVVDGDVAIGTVDSYLIARMTRGLEHVTDATNASRTLLYDIRSGEWSAELCALFEVPIEALPRIVDSYGVVARTEPSAFLGSTCRSGRLRCRRDEVHVRHWLVPAAAHRHVDRALAAWFAHNRCLAASRWRSRLRTRGCNLRHRFCRAMAARRPRHHRRISTGRITRCISS